MNSRWLFMGVALVFSMTGCMVTTSECASDGDCSGEACAESDCLGTTAMALSDGGKVAVGGFHTCVTDNIGVRCWGANSAGQLGYGNTTFIGDTELPRMAGHDVQVGGTVKELALGEQHTCALLTTGAVRCWGYNGGGVLGYGHVNNIGDNEKPSSAGDVDIGGAVVQIAAGAYHTCALLDTGAVRCWGNGAYGKLGYGATKNIGDDETPASRGDIKLLGKAIQITAGHDHTCALLDTGAVRCWGRNDYGQLGYGHTATIGDDETPAAAGSVQVGEPVMQIRAGAYHTCALLESGAVRCWGLNVSGTLGYGHANNIGDNETPASAGNVDIGIGAIDELAAGYLHTCVRSGGRVRCWGYGGAGRLGYGNTQSIGDNEHPAAAGDVLVGPLVVRLALGSGAHSCVLAETGGVRCWGAGGNGQLGYGTTWNVGDDEPALYYGDVVYR